MFAFAKYVIDVFKSGNVALRKAFLVWNKYIESGRAKPAGKDALQKDVGIEFFLWGEPVCIDRNATAVAHSHFVSCGRGDGVDEIDIAI